MNINQQLDFFENINIQGKDDLCKLINLICEDTILSLGIVSNMEVYRIEPSEADLQAVSLYIGNELAYRVYIQKSGYVCEYKKKRVGRIVAKYNSEFYL